MGNGYDGNPYASEQGPADDETDDVINHIERAIEIIEEGMGYWATARFGELPDQFEPHYEARNELRDALEAYRSMLTPETETKPGNECRFCTNWVDVENGVDTCANCQKIT
ncbi:hypothetical protein [Spirosoma spitsbergense]|uniref:hypothetical protein n=1 Tax=Spirosoma spitsbergense TaxID=431554 RepID=UPI00036057FF|nr:hypothetical protein [Spirosoma spitsbergense]